MSSAKPATTSASGRLDRPSSSASAYRSPLGGGAPNCLRGRDRMKAWKARCSTSVRASGMRSRCRLLNTLCLDSSKDPEVNK